MENNNERVPEEGFELQSVIGRTVTIEQLKGRNYYHYTKGCLDRRQPGTLRLGKFLEYHGGRRRRDKVTPELTIPKKYRELFPRNCWVRRFVSVMNPYLCYILCIEVGENGRIEKVVFIEQYSKPSGWNDHYMSLLTKRDRSDFYYEISFDLPEKVVDELKSLVAGRYIPSGFKLIGRKLPSYFIDRGRTYALQSPYRLAYMNIVVKTDETLIIQDIEYSTVLADGKGWSALFSIDRKQIEDRKDERADMLIYIYDKYSDEEIRTMGW